MSDIPKARQRLQKLVRDGLPSPWKEEVEAALAMMKRRAPAKPVAAATKRRVGPKTAAAIRAYVEKHPTAHLQDIAVVFGTNAGRISEAIHGDR